MELSESTEQPNTEIFWEKSPFIAAIDIVKRWIAEKANWTVEIINWLWEKVSWILTPKVIWNVWMTSARTMAIVWLLSWCVTVNHKFWNWVNVTWDFAELSAKCENSVDSWNSFEKSVKEQLSEKANNHSWLSDKLKKKLLKLIEWWNIPENVKVEYCLDEITDLKAEYNAFYIFSLTLHLKTDVNQENIQYVTASFNKWSKTLHKIDLKPRRIWWENEVKTASNF